MTIAPFIGERLLYRGHIKHIDMIALISPAKGMVNSNIEDINDLLTEPRFKEHTQHIAALMLAYSSGELEKIFKISGSIARELKGRFLDLHDNEIAKSAAIDSYDGVVYKHFKRVEGFTIAEREYLQQRVRISSLLYGLLRPLDLIKPYRMEGFVRLSGSDMRIDRFWRDHQTQTLIDDVRESGGTLLYLASKEEQNAFHWRQVTKSVRVIDILFLQQKRDKLRQVVIYTKMARGEMIGYMMKHKIDDPEKLKAFEWAGYRYNDQLSSSDSWVWLMD